MHYPRTNSTDMQTTPAVAQPALLSVAGAVEAGKTTPPDRLPADQQLGDGGQTTPLAGALDPAAGAVFNQAFSVTPRERARLNGHAGKVLWFTGLSGSGKSTIANALEVTLHAQGRHTYVLDGDNIRLGLNKDLGFTDADRTENIRRIAEVAKLMLDAGLSVMTAFISPFRRDRAMARELIGESHFIEVYMSTPLASCERRDVKGLYKKARNGPLPNMTGIGSPYEAPLDPHLQLDGDQIGVDDSVAALLAMLTVSTA